MANLSIIAFAVSDGLVNGKNKKKFKDKIKKFECDLKYLQLTSIIDIIF